MDWQTLWIIASNAGVDFLVLVVGMVCAAGFVRVMDRVLSPMINFDEQLAKGNKAVGFVVGMIILETFLFAGDVLGASSTRYDDDFRKAMKRNFGRSISWQYLKAQGQPESGMNAKVCSSVGACGLMQFMPGTARQFGLQNRFDAKASIRGDLHAPPVGHLSRS